VVCGVLFSGAVACFLLTCVSVTVVFLLHFGCCFVQIAALPAAFLFPHGCGSVWVLLYSPLLLCVGFWGGVMGLNSGVFS
jgi:hypothetical protein